LAELKYFTQDELKAAGIEGKLVLARVDTNSTLVNGVFPKSERIRAAAKTISDLLDAGAKVLFATHNGRKGLPDYVSIGQLMYNPLFVNIRGKNAWGPANTLNKEGNDLNNDTIKAIEAMDSGQVLFLENMRFSPGEKADVSPEEHAQSPFVRTLIDKLDLAAYVNDAFSCSHRAHRSIVGFSALPNVAGLTMAKELEPLCEVQKRFEDEKRKKLGLYNTYILGGKKVPDYFSLMESATEKGIVDKILLTGVTANMALMLKGAKFNEHFDKLLAEQGLEKYFSRLDRLLTDYEDIFELPLDLATSVGKKRVEVLPSNTCDYNSDFLDIGSETIARYLGIIDKSSLVYLKGPPGAFDIPDKGVLFSDGSREILNKIVSRTKSGNLFSVTGGGDTTSMLERFRVHPDGISYVSLAGGALLKFFAGGNLPGLDCLSKSYEKYGGKLTL